MPEPTAAEQDSGFWRTRARALAAVARADALAVVLPLPDGRYFPFASHNVPADRAWLDGTPHYLVWTAVKQIAVQRRAEAEVPLADGRTARSLAVAPLQWNGRSVGALVALREAPDEDESLGTEVARLADLVALELAVSAVLQRARVAPATDDGERTRALEDRRHALALYELTRAALRGDASGTATMLADVLAFDVVGVWREDAGALVLDDGHGYAAHDDAPRADVDGIVATVLRDGATAEVDRASDGAHMWLGPAARAIVTRVAFRDGSTGVLVLGAARRPIAPAELTLAPLLADAVGLSRARTPVAAVPAPAEDAAAAPSRAPRRAWVTPLLVVAGAAVAVGSVLGEPLVFVLAGLVILVAVWGWLA